MFRLDTVMVLAAIDRETDFALPGNTVPQADQRLTVVDSSLGCPYGISLDSLIFCLYDFTEFEILVLISAVFFCCGCALPIPEVAFQHKVAISFISPVILRPFLLFLPFSCHCHPDVETVLLFSGQRGSCLS